MQLDIVFVTYNSAKWIDNCFDSIVKSDYDLEKVSIYVVDNSSTDQTYQLLTNVQGRLRQQFNQFELIQAGANLGFGGGNNLGAAHGASEFIFFLNIDTELERDTLSELSKAIGAAKKREHINSTTTPNHQHSSAQGVADPSPVGIWELRQFPYEHPKHYDPITQETSWASGAAMVIRRELYNAIGGFDQKIFMYAEDVDLSWRARAAGYTIRYVPGAVVNHYSYAATNEIKPLQYYNSVINNFLLRWKFGSKHDIYIGIRRFLGLMRRYEAHKSRKTLLQQYLKSLLRLPQYLSWRYKHREQVKAFKPRFLDWDYEDIRQGAFYPNQRPQTNPKVSVLVRTCGRPSVLREALLSLRNQTYRNIEIIVVEDGPNSSQSLIEQEFADLDIKYSFTHSRVGRCAVGNLALQASSGKYCNFLDDDDLFFADHVEVLVNALEKNPDYRAAYSIALETAITITSTDPYKYSVEQRYIVHRQPFNKLLLFHHNFLPIQCIMFEREIYLAEGGFDEELDFLEDWDLWVRYALRNKYLFIEKETSIYRVPAEKTQNESRAQQLHASLEALRDKQARYFPVISIQDIAEELETGIFKNQI